MTSKIRVVDGDDIDYERTHDGLKLICPECDRKHYLATIIGASEDDETGFECQCDARLGPILVATTTSENGGDRDE